MWVGARQTLGRRVMLVSALMSQVKQKVCGGKEKKMPGMSHETEAKRKQS